MRGGRRPGAEAGQAAVPAGVALVPPSARTLVGLRRLAVMVGRTGWSQERSVTPAQPRAPLGDAPLEMRLVFLALPQQSKQQG